MLNSHRRDKAVSDEKPNFFYKYRNIEKKEDLYNDFKIDALIKNKAIFSSRKKFNDLFDSKIELINPTLQEIEELKKQKLGEKAESELSKWFEGKNLNSTGIKRIDIIKEKLVENIDALPLFCVSSNASSNLMWSHYADSHTGFCIEFKSAHMTAKKVVYKKKIPEIKVVDMLRPFFGLGGTEDLRNKIIDALCTKLNEWEYESEYRVIDSNDRNAILTDRGIMEKAYNPTSVESIIFGCRMDCRVRDDIVRAMPKGMKYKQAVERMSGIEIVDVK